MKNHRVILWAKSLLICLMFGCSGISVLGQPQPISIPKLDRSFAVNSISNLRVAELSEDGTELTLVMKYTYNGRAGSSAMLVPIIDRRDQPNAGGWFGADMISVPPGEGPVSIKVKFFNDEPGVPATFTSDRVRVLMLNNSGSSIIGGKNLLKTVEWGKEGDANSSEAKGLDDTPEETIELAAVAEERARNEARLAAEAEAQALEAIASSQTDEQKLEARSLAEKNARIKTEAAARATEAALILKEQKELIAGAATSGTATKADDIKTRITNVEIVNRSRDRSRMTLGIEFELKDKFGFTPRIGVRVQSSDIPGSVSFFESETVEIDKRKKFVLIPVSFVPPENSNHQTLATDQVEVYVTDEAGEKTILLDSVVIAATWRADGVVVSERRNDSGSIVLQEFRQRNQQSGYATVKYHLPTGNGELRVRVFDSSKPESASWFETNVVPVESGRGLELVPVAIASNSNFPGGDVVVDTVEVELLGQSGQVVETVTRMTSINWSREN